MSPRLGQAQYGARPSRGDGAKESNVKESQP
jgi:hypothetical protein